MQNPETFSPPEQSDNKPVEDNNRLPEHFIANSEDIRRMLAVEEGRVAWRKIMGTLSEEPKMPQDSGVDAVQKEQLKTMYAKLTGERRQSVLEAFDLVIEYHNLHKDLSEIQRKAALRELAQYVHLRRKYDNVWNGNIGATVEIEEYFAKQIKNTPRETAAVTASTMLIRMQYDVAEGADLKTSPLKLAPSTEQIALGAIRHRMQMQDVTECFTETGIKADDTPFKEFLRKAGFGDGVELTSNDVAAAKLLIGFLHKRYDSIELQAKIRNNGDVNSLSLANALEATTGAPELRQMTDQIGQVMMRLMSEGPADLREAAKEVFAGMELPDSAVEAMLAPLADLQDNPTTEEAATFRDDAKEVTKFCMTDPSSKISVRLYKQHYAHLTESTQQPMVDRLVEQALSDETKQMLLQSVFITPDTGKSWMETLTFSPDITASTREALNDIFNNKKLTMREAYQLQYLTYQKNNFMLLSFFTVNLLNSHGYTSEANQLQMKVTRQYLDVVMEDADDIANLAEELGITEEQATEMENFRKYMTEIGVHLFTGLLNKIRYLNVYHPEFAIPFVDTPIALTAGGAAMFFHRMYVNFRWRQYYQVAQMNDAELEKWAQKNTIPIDRAKAGQDVLKDIVDRHHKLHLSTNAFVRRFYMPDRSMRLETRSFALTLPHKDLAMVAYRLKGVKSVGTINDLTRKLYRFNADPNVMAAALYEVGYSKEEAVQSVRTVLQERYEAENRAQRSIGANRAELDNAVKMAQELEIDQRTFDEVDERRKRGLDAQSQAKKLKLRK